MSAEPKWVTIAYDFSESDFYAHQQDTREYLAEQAGVLKADHLCECNLNLDDRTDDYS